MKTGDSVTITKRTAHPYIITGRSVSMTGLQGRIFCIYRSCGVIYAEIEFDSVSLRQMGDAYIKKVLESDTDFACVDVSLKSVSLSEPRDTPEDVIAVRKEICEKFNYISVLDDGTCKIWERTAIDEEDIDALPESMKDEDGLLSVKVSTCRVKGLKILWALIQKERKREKLSRFIKLPERKRKKK